MIFNLLGGSWLPDGVRGAIYGFLRQMKKVLKVRAWHRAETEVPTGYGSYLVRTENGGHSVRLWDGFSWQEERELGKVAYWCEIPKLDV